MSPYNASQREPDRWSNWIDANRLAFHAVISLAALAITGGAVQPVNAQQAVPTMSQLPPISPIAKPTYKMEVPLYSARKVKNQREQWESYLGGAIVRNVTIPTLIPLFPEAGKANGTAVIYAPGGGFRYLSMSDTEPRLLADLGVTVFILKYRTVPTSTDPRTFLSELFGFLNEQVVRSRQANAAQGEPLHATPAALEDGLAAVRLVRSRATEWGVDPARVGFMGGSAGGMTALDVAFTGDAGARPDFVVAMISPKKVAEVPVTAPPLFTASAVDDPLFPGTTENLVAAWSKAGRPVEAHFFERGGHGLPKGSSAERWFDALAAWLSMHGWVGTPK